MTYRNKFSYKEIFRFVAISLCIVFGAPNSGLLPAQAQTNTWYVDGTNGNDNNNGSAQTPWKTVQKAINTINPGSTVIIRSGIYRVDEVQFGPAGTGINTRTIFKALPSDRVIFSRSDNLTPHIVMADYVRIENLWFGGTWDKANNGGLFQVGGSPVATGKQIINCTIFGYQGGINIGSSQNLLLQGNRFIHNGNGDFDHAMYIAGGGSSGSMTNHIIIDNNIVLLGEGYAIHGWHGPRTIIVTRNFVSNHMYGLVMGGQGEAYDHLIANNIIWKEPNRGAQLPGTNTTFINNVMGPTTGIIEDYKATNLVIKNDAFWDSSPGTRGNNPIGLNSGQTQSALGLSDSQIDGAIAALDGSFNQSVQAIFADSAIESSFQKLHSFNIPSQSPLHQTGINWMGGSTGLDLGTGIQVPADETGFWNAFRGMGLQEYDRFGNIIQAPTGPTSTSAPSTILPTSTMSRTLTSTTIPSTATFTPTTGSLGCPCNLWGSQVPATSAQADAKAVELGLRFQASVSGYISGIRFYKGSTNTGTHVGHLWTAGGTLLAEATFSNETASGWQRVNFNTPVAIMANTTYVASYYAPNGNYALNMPYFNSAYVNGPLKALANSNGGNGVYVYGALGQFPINSWQASNYWVDVVFTDSVQPSATLTKTNIPLATPITPTATLTPVIPTATFTASTVPPTATWTPTTVPPTATNTPVPVGPSLTVEVNPASASVGSTVSVAIKLSNVSSLYGLQVECQVDPAILKGVSHLEGDIFTSLNSFIIDTGFQNDGKWSLAASLLNPAPVFNGSGTAFSLNFTVLNAGHSAVNCSVLAVDSEVNLLPVSVINGGFDGVPAPVQTATPTNVPPTNTPAPPTNTPVPTLTPTLEPTLTPMPGAISGVVKYEKRSDQSGITVKVSANGAPLAEVQTSADGSFHFDNVPADQYLVQFSGAGHLSASATLDVQAGQGATVQITLLAGDIDGNGVVDLTDAGFIGANYKVQAPPAPTQADLNGDGVINLVDLVLVGKNFGKTTQ